MITVIQSQGELLLKAHYNYGKRLRELPLSRFDDVRKVWVVPKELLPIIKESFKGELYFKTPEEEITGEVTSKDTPFYNVALPELKIRPYQYQIDGASFMIDRLENYGFCLNSDEVGLGKTIQSILCIKYFMERGARRILICCKRSLKHQWRSELYRFLGETETLPIYITEGNKKKRDKIYEAVKKEDRVILCCNYQNFLNDNNYMSTIGFDFAVIDEAHIIKGHAGKMNNLIAELAQKIPTILLTGTPIMSRPEDIYGVLKLGSSDYLGEYKDFKEKYLVTIFGIYGEQVIGAKNLDELRTLISNVMIRRTLKEAQASGDGKNSAKFPTVLPAVERIAQLDKTQEKILSYIDSQTEDLDARKSEILSKGTIGGQVTDEAKAKINEINEKAKMYIGMKQFASDDPRIFLESEASNFAANIIRTFIPQNYQMSEKNEMTLDLVEEIVSAGEKVIIFSHYATPARLLKRDIEEKLKEPVLMFTGRESDKEREENIRAFKEDPSKRILIGTEAAAEGLNLQVAGYLINYEQAETYAQREQRIGRIRRAGSSHDSLRIYDIYSDKSFDIIRKNKLLKDKELAESLLV